jgi:hypothetical protein
MVTAQGYSKLLTTRPESAITDPMRVQDFDKEPRPTWGEEMFPSSNRIPEFGSWAATIAFWVFGIAWAVCGCWEGLLFMGWFSLGFCPPLNRAGRDVGPESSGASPRK